MRVPKVLIFQKMSETSSLEKQHIKGYQSHPVQKGEFDIWEDEQVWESLFKK